MPPTIHCVRHAQGYHNISVANHSIHDPQLTSFGEEQCRNLAKKFPDLHNVDLVVASPLKRTLNTALIAFEPVIKEKGLKVIALPELQETSDLPCDTGSSPDVLEREYAGKPVDLSLVKEGWNCKRMKWAPTATAIEKRARDARLWLAARPEKDIVVVSHGGFLHYFTEDWTGTERYVGTGWANTEYRDYTFRTKGSGRRSSSSEQVDQIEEPYLVETLESRARRLGTEKPLDHNEATQLKRTKTNEIENKAKELSDFEVHQHLEDSRQRDMARHEGREAEQIHAKA